MCFHASMPYRNIERYISTLYTSVYLRDIINVTISLCHLIKSKYKITNIAYDNTYQHCTWLISLVFSINNIFKRYIILFNILCYIHQKDVILIICIIQHDCEICDTCFIGKLLIMLVVVVVVAHFLMQFFYMIEKTFLVWLFF